MAKKILAVVLAVMVAVSAMAITAFADTTISLYPASFNPDNGGFNSNDGSYENSIFEVTFDIPLYALYGYMDSDHYMVFTLPNDFGPTWGLQEIEWYLEVNGTPYSLEKTKNGATLADLVYDYDDAYGLDGAAVSEHKVNFGYATHNFVPGFDTTIPQSTGYGQIASVRLIAKLVASGNQWWSPLSKDYKDPNNAVFNKCNVQFFNKDGTKVDGSISFINSWNPSDPTYVSANASGTGFKVVADEWSILYNSTWDPNTNSWINPDGYNGQAIPLTWDHTLQNTAIIRDAALNGIEKVNLVVEFNGSLYGEATYSLFATTDQTRGINWWNYNGSRQLVAQDYLDGAKDTLVFEVPVSVLYDWSASATNTNYGTYNQEFVIFENITLLNSNLMTDYLNYNWGVTVSGKGSLGRLSWNDSKTVLYDGNAVRYAAGGITDNISGAWNQAPVTAKAVYLSIPEIEDDTTDVEQPVEPTDTDEEEEDVDAETPSVDVEPEPEDNAPAANDSNPTTGVALAVVPMLVAAAAAVVSKKH